MNKYILSLQQSNHYSFYAALFRVFMCFHLLKDIFFQWEYIPILYGGQSFYTPPHSLLLQALGGSSQAISNHIYIFMGVYISLILLYMLGIGKWKTAVLVFVGNEILQALCPTLQNGGDNILRFCLLYYIFINSYNHFCLPLKPNTARPTSSSFQKVSNLTSNLACLSICIHLCLAYLVSGLFKVHTDMWFNGVANYYILQLERFKGTSLNTALAKNGLFVTLSTYFTLAIEISYPFLIWFNKTRYIMIAGAVLLHLGIYIFMMIYDFQWMFIMLQGFLIPNRVWEKAYHYIKRKLPTRQLNKSKQRPITSVAELQ